LLLRQRMAALQILTGRKPGLRLALWRLATQISRACQAPEKDRLRAAFCFLQ
jgi:hypothetical protein